EPRLWTLVPQDDGANLVALSAQPALKAVLRDTIGRGWQIAVPLALFALFCIAYMLVGRKFSAEFPYSYPWEEMLLNYQGGLTKRALLGELAFRLDNFIPAQQLITWTLFLAYALTAAALIFLLRVPMSFPGLLFMLSPAGMLFPLITPLAYGRKDIFVIAVAVLSIFIMMRIRHRTATLLLIMAIYLIGGLIAEYAWFYFPLLFSVFL